ncbi:MAG: hypothetical protein IPM47_05365 [Sphingobacteriales bacterium]|nr:MAG: hypothetical protein IPM47_05365 [Sphingobacteriales bacterium]
MKQNRILWLKILCFCVFSGRAWQHLRWDAPYRAFLWSESLLSPLFKTFGRSWQYYVSNSDAFIVSGIKVAGVFFVLAAVCSLIAAPFRRLPRIVLPVGGIMLFVLALMYWKEKSFLMGELLEYSAQVACPWLLYASVYRSEVGFAQIKTAIKIAVALTFLGHGLFAIGYYPVPGFFQQMMVNTFGWSEITTKHFLFVAGVLDIAVAVGIFLPYIKTPLLVYAAGWGFITALARIVANYNSNIPLYSLDLWLFEVIYRLPHGALPLLLLFIDRDNKEPVKGLN